MSNVQPIGPEVTAAIARCVAPEDVPRATTALLQFGTETWHGQEQDRVRGYILATALFRRTPPVDVAIVERVSATACRDYRDVLQGMAYPEVLQTLEKFGLPR
jgi:hypothetical protein